MQKADENHLDRVRNYHFFVNRSNWSCRVCKLENFLQRILGICRIEEAYYGNNRCIITDSFVYFLLSKEKWIRKAFRFTKCCDEIYKQTLLYKFGMNEFKDKGSVRYIDWNRGNPYTFTIADLDLLISSDKLFAMKFSSAHLDVIDAISSKNACK